MAKALLLLGINGLAREPARICAETSEEAAQWDLPLIEEALSQVGAVKEASCDGARYRLMDEGQPVGTVEIFEIPRPDHYPVVPSGL